MEGFLFLCRGLFIVMRVCGNLSLSALRSCDLVLEMNVRTGLVQSPSFGVCVNDGNFVQASR